LQWQQLVSLAPIKHRPQVRFLVSPDEDFSQIGANSGTSYLDSFKTYKKMMTDPKKRSMYERIFSEFNASLFGTEPKTQKRIAKDGDYSAELQEYEEGLLADRTVEVITDEELLPESIPNSPTLPVLDSRIASIPNSPIPSAPELPAQFDRNVSVSVASRVSTAATVSSWVSNVVSTSVTIPLIEPEVEESPPPSPKVKAKAKAKATTTRPAPRKKKQTEATSEVDPTNDTIPGPSKKAGKAKANITPVGPAPTRTLRNRG
jgi:hypothetical protein